MATDNLAEAARALTDLWAPKILGRVNDQFIKVAKVKGELAWHKHEQEDELFLVLEGALDIEYEDHVVSLRAGEFHVVPRGTMHNPVAKDECLIALVETVTTQHTGDVVTHKTRSIAEQLGEDDI